MISYIFGEDTFGASQALFAHAQKEKATVKYIGQEQAALTPLRELVAQGSTLFGAVLPVVRDPSLWRAAGQAEIVSLLKKGEEIKVIFWDRAVADKRTAVYAALKKFGKEFPLLSAYQLESWLEEEAVARGAGLEKGVARLLVERVGSNRWRLLGELEKLCLRFEHITLKAAAACLPPAAASGNSFAFVEAVVSRQPKQAITMLQALLAEGEAELGLLGLLAWQLRSLLVIQLDQQRGLSSTDIARQRGLAPYTIEKGAALARRLPPAFLLDGLSRLLATDFAIKQGRVDARTGLTMTVLGLAT